MINTTVAGTITGIGSAIFGILMVGLYRAIPFHDLILAYIVFTVIYLVESAVMGFISYKLYPLVITAGLIYKR